MAEASNSKTVMMRRVGNALEPIDEKGLERVQSIKRGELVMVGIRKPRNPQHHRMAWGIARIVFENTERFDSADHVMEQIKVGVGHSTITKLVIPGVGEIDQVRGRSINFESMDQTEFKEFFDLMIEYVCAELMPGVDPKALRREVQ